MSTDRPAGEAEPEPSRGKRANGEGTVPDAASAASDDVAGPPGGEHGTPEAAPDAGPASTAPGAEAGAPSRDGAGSPDEEPATASEPQGSEPSAPSRGTAGRPGGEQASGDGGAPAGSGARSAVAEALAAAVRAVESGERDAASFFNEPKAKPAARRPAPAPAAAGPAVAGPGAVAGPVRAARIAPSAGLTEVLAAGGAPEALAGQVAEALGENAAEELREDPWRLLAVPAVQPEQADGFARALLGDACGPADERRARALVGRFLERAALAGHTVLESSAVVAELSRRSVPDPEAALRDVLAEGTVLVFREGPEDEGEQEEKEDGGEPVRLLLGLDRYAMAEESLADGLARLVNATPEPGPDWSAAAEAAPSPSAAELIRAVAAAGLVTHSGGEAARAEPAALVTAAAGLGLRAWAAAHTEDGRRRLTGLGVADAVTVAGLLSGQEGPGRDADGALALDVLAVLDAPQLDVETAALLVESLADGTRLVLGGDPGVLWSAGPGRVFADVLAARACPAIVSRTPDPGPIGELVSGIGVGELNQVPAPGKEVVIVPVREPAEAVHRTVQLVAESVPRAFGIEPGATQVITPGHGGPAGTRALNAALKERLNPGPGRFGGFDPGDRVAYVPAPGRMVPGTVVSADAEGLRLDCGGAPVVVPRERVGDEVRHGWAVTAHQAAGTRWPAAVVVLPGDAAPTLTRSWVYTAFGRAERHLSVVHGVEQALPRAVAEVPAKERTTRLRALLEAQTRPAG
ncbi:helix-hairpin-helix domain-containing protein [Streptomyces hesseae]|uniref:Helix-hairpin-helix domain-containing protein n=1 Tax=Streptomyces hesseae TaxID=3075519 RepID=A0ABU2SQM1_9ACTN|nr:helix-hairpin-helix domain-containing protein [Streptomyces sp. DSM 40473]MDT0451284.1 helix-hairpin-helix domain-containing protein [Streptomyces sp. DSM 40473]